MSWARTTRRISGKSLATTGSPAMAYSKSLLESVLRWLRQVLRIGCTPMSAEAVQARSSASGSGGDEVHPALQPALGDHGLERAEQPAAADEDEVAGRQRRHRRHQILEPAPRLQAALVEDDRQLVAEPEPVADQRAAREVGEARAVLQHQRPRHAVGAGEELGAHLGGGDGGVGPGHQPLLGPGDQPAQLAVALAVGRDLVRVVDEPRPRRGGRRPRRSAAC